jgi:hypothetical protein
MNSIIHNGKKINISMCFTSGYLKGGYDSNEKAFIFGFQNFGKKLKIHFIRVYKQNEGLGSLALSYLENKAFENNYKIIYGELVDGKDSSTPSKLTHFYKKNGYTIILTGETYIYADISKNLSGQEILQP